MPGLPGWRRAALLLGLVLLGLGLGHDIGPPRLALLPVGFAALEGWSADRVSAAVPAFLKSCARFLTKPDEAPLDPWSVAADFGRVADWRGVCELAAALPPGDDAAARHFFRSRFVPVLALDRYRATAREPVGLFTGYFEIGLKGSLERRGRYQTPIYKMPADAALASRYARAEIEDGALAGQHLALLWVDDPIDAFFLQIQGSGRVRLDNGKTVRLGYGGQNRKPYVPVGRLLLDRGIIPREQLTMLTIREWMAKHKKAGAALRREDPSYVFFRILKGPGPKGAEGVVLSPRRSLAVDPAAIPLGVPLWLDARERFGAQERLRRLVVAQDTGGAIKGPVRGDLFWGTGEKAGIRAGRMNARGRYFLLLPRRLAARLAATG
ncbi:MAG TPA: MltA domain-containing protein [Stellaceae bacterium]|nr:MltA domain-containing protein [Stellaceae bacterium]